MQSRRCVAYFFLIFSPRFCSFQYKFLSSSHPPKNNWKKFNSLLWRSFMRQLKRYALLLFLSIYTHSVAYLYSPGRERSNHHTHLDDWEWNVDMNSLTPVAANAINHNSCVCTLYVKIKIETAWNLLIINFFFVFIISLSRERSEKSIFLVHVNEKFIAS